jgi:hypothetical protein
MARRAPAAVDIPDLGTRLASIEADLRDLRDIVDRLTAGRVAADDRPFLDAVAAAVGDRLFSCRELINHAIVDATLRSALGDVTARRLGKRLRRLSGSPIGPYRVMCVDRDQDGQIWRLQVDHLQPNA